jgi:hypothetical protein
VNQGFYKTAYLKFHGCVCYAKHLITSLASEHIEKQVHDQRFMPILRRVLPIKLNGFEFFFQAKSKDMARQFVELLVQFGEIVHLGNGYYSFPPARHVQFPISGRKVAMSLLEEPDHYGPGLFGQLTDQPLPTLLLEEWAYADTPIGLLERYENELEEDPTFQPDELFYGTPYGIRRAGNSTASKSNSDATCLLAKRPFKHAEKRNWYIGRKKSDGWQIVQVDTAHLRRLRLGIELRHGKQPTFHFLKYDRQHLELKLSQLIPKEEQMMLALIGLPECWPDPKRYLICNNEMEDAMFALTRLQMKEDR